MAASAWMLSLAAACGGGGGTGGTPQQPSLEVGASAQTVAAGSPGVQVTATTAHTSGAVAWALTGPGSLSTTTGPQVVYTPPLPSRLGNATTATVTGSVDGLQRVVSITLVAAPGKHWQTVKLPAGDLAGAHYLGGRYFVSQPEALLTSTDGQNWSAVALPDGGPGTLALAFGPLGYVAVGQRRVLHSADGLTWTTASIAASNDATSLDPRFLQLQTVAAGNGTYVATGVQGVATSTDGVNWRSRTGGVDDGAVGIGQVTFGAGRFIGVGARGNFSSVDGVTWTRVPGPGEVYGVAYGNGLFVASNGVTTSTSVDGLTWAAGGSVSDTTARSYTGPVTFTGGRFHAYGEKGVDASTDGVHWTQLYTNTEPSLDPMLKGVASSGSGTIIVGARAKLLYSAGDTGWKDVGPGRAAQTLALDCMGATCLAWGSDGQLLRSTDAGATWAASRPTDGLAMWTLTHGNGRFVATSSGSVHTSPDGVNWARSGLASPTYFYATAYGDGRFVIAGAGYGLYTSTDGSNWMAATGRPTPPLPGSTWTVLAHGAGRFVVVDDTGNLYTSTDGQQWTAGPKGLPMRALTYGATAGFVGVGDLGAVWRSTDGLTWSAGTAGATRHLGAVAFGHSQYVAAGESGSLFVSEDALTWTPRTLDIQSNLTELAYSGTSFVVSGGSGAIVVSAR